jgi:hypothetical protein
MPNCDKSYENGGVAEKHDDLKDRSEKMIDSGG